MRTVIGHTFHSLSQSNLPKIALLVGSILVVLSFQLGPIQAQLLTNLASMAMVKGEADISPQRLLGSDAMHATISDQNQLETARAWLEKARHLHPSANHHRHLAVVARTLGLPSPNGGETNDLIVRYLLCTSELAEDDWVGAERCFRGLPGIGWQLIWVADKLYVGPAIETGIEGRVDESQQLREHGKRLGNLGVSLLMETVSQDDHFSWFQIGTSARRFGSIDTSIWALERAVALAPRTPAYQRELGISLLYAGQPQQAVGHLERAVALNPKDSYAHNQLAGAYRRVGQPERAVPHAKLAAELIQPPNSGYYRAWGDACREAGELFCAREAYQRALQLNPNDSQAQAKLDALSAQDSAP
ncbi:MAG TPA: tetratricopeptide repeat protein [Anaerolineae bacterium]|nr:tetratricopeptide repeat protein [Anaerolineae bacterium]